MKPLQVEVAIITGTARGIGRAQAVAYAREDAAVVGIDKAAQAGNESF